MINFKTFFIEGKISRLAKQFFPLDFLRVLLEYGYTVCMDVALVTVSAIISIFTV